MKWCQSWVLFHGVNIIVDFVPPVGELPVYLSCGVGGFLAVEDGLIAEFED